MPSEMLTKQKDPSSPTPPAAVASEEDALRAATRQHVKRVRRLKINVAAWVLGTLVLNRLWALIESQDNARPYGSDGLEPGVRRRAIGPVCRSCSRGAGQRRRRCGFPGRCPTMGAAGFEPATSRV